MSRYAGRLPTTYAEAEKALKGRPVRTVLNNTRISRQDEETIEVQYHGNTIATFHQDGSKELTTCGWGTSSSTRDRLNAMLWGEHIGFIQAQRVGYIEVGTVDGRERHHADTIEIEPSGAIHRIINSRES